MARNWTFELKTTLSADGTNSSLFVDDTADYLLTGDYPINALEVAFTDTTDRHVAVNVAAKRHLPDRSISTHGWNDYIVAIASRPEWRRHECPWHW